MPKRENGKLDNIKEKLDYIGLDLKNIPKFYEKNEQIEYRTIHENEFKKFKVYKYVNVKDIQILITPKNRLDPLIDKYKSAKRISNYINPKEDEDIPLHATFLKMLKEVETEDIKKIEIMQEKLSKKIPFKVEYEGNYKWEIYYSEAYKKYFMLVPSEEKDYECLFYLIKKQLESIKSRKINKIFVPICYMEYTGEYLKKVELEDMQNYMWLFTGDWPKIYEVFDKKQQMTIQIVGETYVFDNLKSYYKITLKDKEEATKFYKFIKAMFILQSNVPNKYKFCPKIDSYGSLIFKYNNKKLEYDKLPNFIEDEYKEISEKLNEITNKKYEYSKEMEEKKKIVKTKENEYLKKEKEITLYLQCKKTFFGKIKFFFKHKKMVKEKSKEDKENISEISKEEIQLEKKQHYNIEDLVNANKKYEEIESTTKNLKIDILALNEKIKMMDRRIKNAQIYIDEIDNHNKSIFEFWKFTNKDEKIGLNEANTVEQDSSNIKIQKTFNIETDFEDFAIKIDNIQRKKLTKEQCDYIFLTQTDLLETINLLKSYTNKEEITKQEKTIIKSKLENLKKEASKEEELFNNEEFDIFGNLSEDNEKIKYIKGKKHREIERNKFKILNINKNTQVSDFINTIQKCIEETKVAFENNLAIENMSLYKTKLDLLNANNLELFNMNIENAIDEQEDEDKINLYKINIKEGDKIIYLSNSIYFNNMNKTLPLGMDVSDKALVDLGEFELELVKKEYIKINQEQDLNNKVKSIDIYEYNLSTQKQINLFF